MASIEFKGKEFVFNHHLTVPYRPIVPVAEKSVGDGGIDGNLIIQGDNLHALKALLPRFAGRVDCIFIDPPYNTGNDKWSYSDNVNSPVMREWLASNPVNREDMLRHDKWLCMMWPRLKLLHELLADHGTFWMTLDDNEVHRARVVLDEIFGDANTLAHAAWEKADSPRMDAEYFSTRHDHVLVYAKDIAQVTFMRLVSDDVQPHYDQLDSAGRRFYLKPLRAMMGGEGERREARPNLYFPIVAPDGTEVYPKLPAGGDGRWRWGQDRVAANADRIEWRRSRNGGWTPYFRIFADEQDGRPPETIFPHADVGSSRTGKAEIKALFPEGSAFETPKPTGLLERILEIAVEPGCLILDSFAGSGTTAHAVLSLNARDNGNRRFILAECEDYADTVTAERVRRVINGVPNAPADHKWHQGLGGTFTYCTLGPPLDLERILAGDQLPDRATLASWLFLTATGEPLPAGGGTSPDLYVGESRDRHVWLIYEPDLAFLKSTRSALTYERAEQFTALRTGKPHLVFAAAKYMPNAKLAELAVEFAPLPFALYRMAGA